MSSVSAQAEADRLLQIVKILWGHNVTKIRLNISENMPFNMFEIRMTLYNSFDILIQYERSIIGINLKIEDCFVNLRNLTKQNLVTGFCSSKDDSILHNLEILDYEVKLLMLVQ